MNLIKILFLISLEINNYLFFMFYIKNKKIKTMFLFLSTNENKENVLFLLIGIKFFYF